MGPNPRYVEELRVGGGYGDHADGGIDFEKNGTIKTNGNLTVDGILSTGHLSVAGKCETGASTTTQAGLRIAPGSTPVNPQDGDIWTTATGIYTRINGSTVGPLGSGSGSIDWGRPGALGSITPNTGIFTTLNTTGNLVCSGDINVNGGDITSSAALFNLTGNGDVRINAGGTDRNVKLVPTGTGGVWCGTQGNGILFSGKVSAGALGTNLVLQSYSGSEAVVIDPQIPGQANLQVGVSETRNGNAELFGNNAAVGGRLVLHKGATATGIASYSIQPGNTGILHIHNGTETVLSIDGNTRCIGINTTVPAAALDVVGSGKFSGRLNTAASGTNGAGFNIPHGNAPVTPINGDVWTTTTGVYFHVNGRTIEALSGDTDWENPGIIGAATPNEATFTTLVICDRISVPASTSDAASFRLKQGVPPVSPSNGDLWTTNQGLYVHTNGKTVGPLMDAAELAAPPGIGSTTPNGGRFTTLEATGCFISAAGTSDLPSIKIRSGIAPSTPETGDVWADNEGFYFRIAGKTLKLQEGWHAVGVTW